MLRRIEECFVVILLAVVVALLLSSMTPITTGGQILVSAYIWPAVFGVLWGIAAFALWWFIVTQCPSLFWIEDEIPENMDTAAVFISLLLPLAAVLTVVLVVAVIAGIKLFKVIVSPKEQPKES
ncbi:MAG: hypothetical protein AAB355_01225 [Patescibacteria group bacterium]